MKKLTLVLCFMLLYWTGRSYPVFTGASGISMLMCEYSGPSLGLGSSVWLQYENSCPTSISY